MNQDFLNRKEVPTHEQIIRFFFRNKEEIKEIVESLEFQTDGTPEDIEKLGRPDKIETVSGTEWELSRVKWNTEKGPKYLIYLKKVGNYFSDIDFPKTNLNYTMDNNLFEKNPFFNYHNEIEDISYENVESLTFKEMMDLAIEYEDYEEAARLRDWDKGLKKLMLELKPMFIEAIQNSDLEALDRYHKRLNDYRAKL
jgi:hypothetical protein